MNLRSIEQIQNNSFSGVESCWTTLYSKLCFHRRPYPHVLDRPDAVQARHSGQDDRTQHDFGGPASLSGEQDNRGFAKFDEQRHRIISVIIQPFSQPYITVSHIKFSNINKI